MYIFWLRSVFELALIMEQEPSWCSVGRFECQTLFLRQEDHESELFFFFFFFIFFFYRLECKKSKMWSRSEAGK